MNDFASTENSPGLLKDTYGDTGLAEALKRRRRRLAETRLGTTKGEVEVEVKED